MNTDKTPKAGHFALWFSQVLLGGFIGFYGWMKLTQPATAYVEQLPWRAVVQQATLRFYEAVGFSVAMGLLLPVLTRTWSALSKRRGSR